MSRPAVAIAEPPPSAVESGDCDQGSAAARLRLSLRTVLGWRRPAVGRLAYAQTSVTFRIGTAGLTLLLDRRPPTIGESVEPAEIEIVLSAAQARRFAAGELSLPVAIVAGEVAFKGPIRKYLSVDPIVRSLLAELRAEL